MSPGTDGGADDVQDAASQYRHTLWRKRARGPESQRTVERVSVFTTVLLCWCGVPRPRAAAAEGVGRYTHKNTLYCVHAAAPCRPPGLRERGTVGTRPICCMPAPALIPHLVLQEADAEGSGRRRPSHATLLAATRARGALERRRRRRMPSTPAAAAAAATATRLAAWLVDDAKTKLVPSRPRARPPRHRGVINKRSRDKPSLARQS